MKFTSLLTKAFYRVPSKLAGCIIILALVLLLCSHVSADAFDWRNVGGNDYTTPVKDQGYCGSCWAFAAVGALEAKFDITYGNPNLNLDLSEQHLICNGTYGDCGGGYEFGAIKFFKDKGIVSESELPYTASDYSPDWPLDPDWMDHAHKITGYQNWLTCTTPDLKLSLESYGPLVAAMNVYTDWFWPSPGAVGNTSTPLYKTGAIDEVGDINHAVLVVGYQDDPSLTEGGYWIVKNSWGDRWERHNGYGYVLYGDLEKHNRVHAITGDAYIVPEPTTLIMLLIGIGGIILHQYRKKPRGSICSTSGVERVRLG